MIDELFARTRAQIGQMRGPTKWREVLQSDITDFGRCTYDPDPMHVDPEWAREHSPFRGTIAFGYWTISMLTSLLMELAGTEDGTYHGIPREAIIGVNYGCDRLRLIEPIPVGARIRAHAQLFSVEKPAPDRILRATDVTVEIENVIRPALVARWLSMSILREGQHLSGFRRTDA